MTPPNNGRSGKQTAQASGVEDRKPPRPTWDEYYLSLAVMVSSRASCLGRAVGAVAVRDNRILATGYNGMPDGWPNCNESERGCPRCAYRFDEEIKQKDKSVRIVVPKQLDVCMCVHAEANVLNVAARFGLSVPGSDLYVTDEPCMQCAKNLLQVGVRSVHYLRRFRVDDPSSEEGRANLAAQHELMRKLGPTKYRQTNVGLVLAKFGNWIATDPDHGLDVPMQRSALDDEQFDR